MESPGIEIALWLIAGATLLLISSAWLFFRLITSRFACPRCGSEDTRGSETERAIDRLFRAVVIRPQRCLSCGNRYYCFGQRT